MPRRLAKPCRAPMCPALVRDGTGYCDEHKHLSRARQKERWRLQDENRPSAARRGYDRRWRKLRQMKLNRSPLCERCLERGIRTPAVEVHHIIPLRFGGSHDMANLRSTCRPCHAIMEAERKRRNPK